MEYIYNAISAFNLERLGKDVNDSAMTDKTLEYATYNQGPEQLHVFFTNTLSAEDKTLLDGIVATNDPSPLPEEEDTVEILLQQGKDKRLKWKGYKFTATAGQTTDHNITMPFNGYIQGGHFHAANSKTGDEISFIILPGDANEYKYLDAVPISQGETFLPAEAFGMTSLLPAGLPMRISYLNTDSTDKLIVFKVAYRLAE